MSIQYLRTKVKFVAIFIAGFFTVSISPIVKADWSIMGLTLHGLSSYVYGINDSGQVLGEASADVDASTIYYPFVTGPDGSGMNELSFRAFGINDSGQMWGA